MRNKSEVSKQIARRRRREAIRLRKRIFAGVLLVFVVFVFLCVRSINNSARLKHYTAVANPVMINGRLYTGRAPIISDQDKLYFPLPDFAKAFGKDEVKLKRGKLLWGEKEYPIDTAEVLRKLKAGGTAVDFISSDAIEQTFKIKVNRENDGICYIDTFPSMDDAWTAHGQLIAASLGSIADYHGTNSKEAFTNSYKRGIRVFEADISMTSDNVPVVVKDWREFRKMAGLEDSKQALAEETFRSVSLYDKYTPLSFADLCKLLVAYPDTYLILNTETIDADGVKTLYAALLQDAGRFDTKLMDRLIPEIYSIEMGDVVLGQNNWKSAIFNFSRTSETLSEKTIVKYALNKGIRCFASDRAYSDEYMLEAIHRFGGKMFLQYYDEMETVEALQKTKGIDGVFTNSLIPNE